MALVPGLHGSCPPPAEGTRRIINAAAQDDGGGNQHHKSQNEQKFQRRSPYSPLTCTVTPRCFGLVRCSNRKIPCHVPSAIRPRLTGIVSDVCVNADLICAGMSSKPSALWLYKPCPSGTSAAKKSSMSRMTRSSAFSWIINDAEVWLIKTHSKPVLMPC